MSYKGMTIYFMRHGETYLNFYHRMQGWSNAPLTEQGKIDVRRSGRGLSDITFDAVYTSDLHRTVETANIVLEENKQADDLVIKTMPQFREVFFGGFDGLKIDEVYEDIAKHEGYDTVADFLEDTNLPQRMAAFRNADEFGDAEDFMMFWSRIEEGLLDIVNKHKQNDETILVVVHGLVIRYMIESLVPQLEDPDALSNASITQIRYEDGLFHAKAYNQTDHFVDLEPHELEDPQEELDEDIEEEYDEDLND